MVFTIIFRAVAQQCAHRLSAFCIGRSGRYVHFDGCTLIRVDAAAAATDGCIAHTSIISRFHHQVNTKVEVENMQLLRSPVILCSNFFQKK